MGYLLEEKRVLAKQNIASIFAAKEIDHSDANLSLL